MLFARPQSADWLSLVKLNLGYLGYFLYSRCFQRKKTKADRYYTLKKILYSILFMETLIEPEKIVINNLHLSIKTLVEWVINRFV
jgi:hypothetical protein